MHGFSRVGLMGLRGFRSLLIVNQVSYVISGMAQEEPTHKLLVCPPYIVLEWLMMFDPETLPDDAISALQSCVRFNHSR
jgi:hypothetical protein